jgi:polyisoprenoid-binding protein YceI
LRTESRGNASGRGWLRPGTWLSLALLLWPTTAQAQTVVRAIDAAHSEARFCVAHLWVERVCGTIAIVSGSATFGASPLVPVAVSATLDPSTVDTGTPDRDAALRSPDFFDVRKFPAWTFASTRIVPTASGAFAMDGTIAIHGVTRPVRLTVTVGSSAAPQYHAVGQLDRHAFGMAVTRLDPTIGGTVDVTLDVRLAKGQVHGAPRSNIRRT